MDTRQGSDTEHLVGYLTDGWIYVHNLYVSGQLVIGKVIEYMTVVWTQGRWFDNWRDGWTQDRLLDAGQMVG
jgi:hypothetical protein